MIEYRLNELCARLPELQCARGAVVEAFRLCSSCLGRKGTLFIAGNGGSRADAEHIAGELMKGFLRRRPISAEDQQLLRLNGQGDGDILASRLQQGFPCVVLGSPAALSSAVANDTEADMVYAQHLYVHGRPGDMLLALSTSGMSRNILLACRVARIREMQILSMTGADGGRLASLSDVSIRVPQADTYRIQELHLPLYHCLCAALEEAFFPD